MSAILGLATAAVPAARTEAGYGPGGAFGARHSAYGEGGYSLGSAYRYGW
jgi:hypothetical protein